jgi:hypothetical protein
MNRYAWYAASLALMTVIVGSAEGAPPESNRFTWSTVVNNGDYMPTDSCNPAAPVSPPCKKFNSYNQPSVNAREFVVFRARSKGEQGPVHGIYTRDMAVSGPVVKVYDRNTLVPQPNNLNTVFHEPPSFPRIDIDSATLVSRGNHQPVWKVSEDERLGTNGVYTNPFGALITGASKLGSVPDFSFFEVPEYPGTYFDVFPGAPSVTDGNIIVFKGNYTVEGAGKTGVYFRELLNVPVPLPGGGSFSGGNRPVVLIANNTDTKIPGTTTVFGSTAPPSAAKGMAVFAGFDNEEKPTLGGIYLAPLTGTQPRLTTLVSIGQQVPGEKRKTYFNRLGEGVSFDGRLIAFWGAWGTETKTLVLQCPTEGNKDRRAYCNEQYPEGATVQVPVHQGIFVADIRTRQIQVIAKTPTDYDNFLYWNFSGHVPGSMEEADGEPARWRNAAFVAVSGRVAGTGASFHVAFKARTGDVVSGIYVNPVDGIYLAQGPGRSQIVTVVETGMDGTLLDPEAIDADTGAGLPVTEMGIERDGLRSDTLVINASMGSEETGWAGIYLTNVPNQSPSASRGQSKSSRK